VVVAGAVVLAAGAGVCVAGVAVVFAGAGGAAEAAGVAAVCAAGAPLCETELTAVAAACVVDPVGLGVAGAVAAGAAPAAGTGLSAWALAAAHRPPSTRTPMITALIGLKYARDRQRAKRRKLQTLANATDSIPILTRPIHG
jgi:hypothetical protein